MCEILAVKKNSHGLEFSKEAINIALQDNHDGAGFTTFKKNRDGTHDLVDLGHFQTTVYRPAIKPTVNEKVYIDYTTREDSDFITLYDDRGAEKILSFPNSLKISSPGFHTYAEEVAAVENWLDTLKIKHDFNYYGAIKEPSALTEGMRNASPTVIDAGTTPDKEIVESLYAAQQRLAANEVIIMHFRRTTSGPGAKNTQPIVGNRFVAIHNGVFSGLGDHEQSDTSEFVSNLEKLYEVAALRGKAKEKAFLEAYLETIGGWYSIFFYSIITKQLYYFRNGASFYSYENETMYATNKERFPNKVTDTTVYQ